jgi:cell shape-determining protein MreC
LAYQIVGSIAMPMIYTCHDVSVCLLSIVITYSMLIVAAVLLHLPFLDIIYLSVVGIVIFVAVANYESNMFSIFTTFSKFELTLRAKVASENKEYLMKTQTEEMRHMIGTCLTLQPYIMF